MFNYTLASPALRAIKPLCLSRAIASSRASLAANHSAESYFKDVDAEPPKDPTVHRVDGGSDAVQRPYEPPAGEFSRTGVEAAESYRTVNKDEPYNSPNDGQGKEKLRYGGVGKDDKGKNTSPSSEGPSGASADGRKPEGKN